MMYLCTVYRRFNAIHQKELDNNKLLLQQLLSAQSRVSQLSSAEKDAAVLRKKVTELQSVHAVVNGESNRIVLAVSIVYGSVSQPFLWNGTICSYSDCIQNRRNPWA